MKRKKDKWLKINLIFLLRCPYHASPTSRLSADNCWRAQHKRPGESPRHGSHHFPTQLCPPSLPPLALLPPQMSSLYIGVYKAIYEYTAQADEELTIYPGDLLYLLEKSDIDDWWKAKKRVVPQGDEEVEEPEGLVPSNYIEVAPVVQKCRGLYDYDKQTEEELTFKEGDYFDIYDLSDPDWLLVGDLSHTCFGFIPFNYIEYTDDSQSLAPANAPTQNYLSSPYTPTTPTTPQAPVPVAQPAPKSVPISQFAPPPVHKDRLPDLPPEASREPEETYPVEEDEVPPPMPSRPPSRPSAADTASPQPTMPTPSRRDLSPADDAASARSVAAATSQEHNFDGEFFRWYIDEVDGRKKRAVVLSIGNGLIILKPNSSNPKKLKLRSALTLDNNWRIRDLINYSNEKKHVFLAMKNPDAEIELHAGSKDVAEAITTILGDLKGAEDQKGLREVARAALTKTSSSNRKVGRLMYDFESQGNDELGVRENDEVYIIDDTKSKEWWMCERIADGRRGVVPSSYIEIVGTTNLDKLTDGVSRRKSQRGSSKGRVVDGDLKRRHRYQSRDDRDRIRESDRIRRDKTKSGRDDKDMPNYHRVRTWIDSTGSFKVEAEFLGFMEGKVHLHKTNGVKIAVAANKLSIEDLEYVEKVADISLQDIKDQIARSMSKRARSSSVGARDPSPRKSASAVAAINDVPPPQPSRPKATTATSQGESEYDWFDFFLSCGVDIGNCQRYTINFTREQMDENTLEDITPSLLRSLGLREGDILRVMKFLDNKFGRQRTAPQETPSGSGGLFTEPTGALKNNSSSEVAKVNASALPAPSPQKEAPDLLSDDNKKFEDDAWAVKPAARSNEDLSKVHPQYTGSLQDLVNIKPLEANKTSSAPAPASAQAQAPPPAPEAPRQATTTTPSAAPLQPVKTGPSQQPRVQSLGALGSEAPLVLVRTGGPMPSMPTGGQLPPQPTGFVPITAQPTGFMPIQQTGGLVPQQTFNSMPLQMGQNTFNPQQTGGMPQTTFGQITQQPTSSFVPLQPGAVTMPQTSFNQQPTGNQSSFGGSGLFGQQTGPQTTFNLQATGPQTSFNQQNTGAANPMLNQQTQSMFGQQTGPMGGQATGGLNTFVPQSSFGRQITGGFMPQTSFGNQPTGGGFPQTSFGNQPTGGQFPQTSFGGQATGGQFPQQSFGNQPTGGFPQTSFGQQATGGGFPQTTFGQQVPQTSFGSQPFSAFNGGQSTGFGGPSFGQQPQNFNTGMGQMTSMFQNTSIGGPQQQAPQTSFGGFGDQPLQSQPTGLGFGNSPMQAQPTGKRANLQAATADNPFGF